MVNSDQVRPVRVALVAGIVSAAAIVLSGCVSSPTYGTDKTAGKQLMEDVSGILALGPSRKKTPQIAYKPRPELVTPETTAVLPEPQDDVTTASNPAWPESPEQRLARIRAEADENADNPVYRSSVINDTREQGTEITYGDPLLSNGSNRERLAEIRRRKLDAQGGNPTSRKYLSEPPLDYRQPAETAPTDELGESEWRKERKARRDAGGRRSLF
ncbi:hypothetical protein [Mesorhizobium sp. Z1-4]|uniref:hypothetical protein n=1 Tax=Mesorhizobium sp. Z1-4 TaxID=2448478 RepID=UPI000FDAE23B|nr:hypothetical protein [Mesorhizobium sp. Z1-4]